MVIGEAEVERRTAIGEVLQYDETEPAANIVIDPQRSVVVTVVATAVDACRDLLDRRVRVNMEWEGVASEKSNELGSI